MESYPQEVEVSTQQHIEYWLEVRASAERTIAVADANLERLVTQHLEENSNLNCIK